VDRGKIDLDILMDTNFQHHWLRKRSVFICIYMYVYTHMHLYIYVNGQAIPVTGYQGP
jgi:hypothetical protein